MRYRARHWGHKIWCEIRALDAEDAAEQFHEQHLAGQGPKPVACGVVEIEDEGLFEVRCHYLVVRDIKAVRKWERNE